MPEPRERLAELLRQEEVPGSFSAHRVAPTDALTLEVAGVGPITFPVSPEQARRLCAVARPATYGRGTLTLLDRRVRDTWEVPKSRVKVDKRRWNAALAPLLAGLGRDLGMAPGVSLRAEFHSMLVYSRGQFFAPHQDSEKDDAMVGSLVVTLPSTFTGGALVIEHGGQSVSHRSVKGALSLVAFYADCRHEVRPVRSGHRVVLTYNLVARGEPDGNAAALGTPPEMVDAVASALEEHFATPQPVRYSHAPPVLPDRLVYLLDHAYTRRGLGWSHLKGSDARRAGVLREAASRAQCELVLALADVHETWSAYETERRWSRYDRRRRWDSFEDDEFDIDDEDGEFDDHDDEYQLEELIEDHISLSCWVDPSGQEVEAIATSVSDGEVCASTPSGDLRPYQSEYEGYMGNYGNTLDRWYHRGALVVWPRSRAFVVHAEASPAWAVEQIAGRIRAKDLGAAREMAASVAPFWRTTVRAGAGGRSLLTQALRAAGRLDDPELGAMLLAPFTVEGLLPSHAPGLAAAVDRYGEAWARALVASLFVDRGHWGAAGVLDRRAWIVALPKLTRALHGRGGGGVPAARLLAQEAWRWLAAEIGRHRSSASPSRRAEALRELGRPALAVLESTAAIGSPGLRDEVLAALREAGEDLIGALMAGLRATRALPSPDRQTAGIDSLAHHCVTLLEGRLARPQRAEGDWSVPVPGGCTCELCATLGAFLADPVQKVLEWPIAQDRRRHVHSRIDGAELPVRHQTRRTGRPYTLVLTKTAALFEREATARHQDEADLAWLRSQQD